MTIASFVGGLIPGPIGWAFRIFAGGKSMLGKAWDWITANTTHLLITALVVGSCVGLIDHKISHHTITKLRGQVAAIHAAQKTAGTAQSAVNHEPARVSGIIASNSDAQAPVYYDAVRRARPVVGVRRESLSCPADLRGADSAVEGVHHADPDPEMVSLPATDFEQLKYGTARALKMQQDALGMIAAGVAVASDPASPPSQTPPGP